MKQVHKTALFLLVISLVAGCSSYKAKKQETQLQLPQLGTLVKTKGSILYETVEQIGSPDWQDLKIEVQQLPFNNESYFTYAKYMHRAGKINSIAYNDTLRFKPKYIRLQLLDKVAYTKTLNKDSNAELRNYLSLDDQHRLVTTVDIAITETDVATFLKADGVLLEKDALDNMAITIVENNTSTRYFLKDLPVFNYGLSTFCWGEDRYHNMRIQNIVSEDFKCPKGTYLNISKIKSDKSYLKF